MVAEFWLSERTGGFAGTDRNYISGPKRGKNRPYAVRKPKEYVAREPGHRASWYNGCPAFSGFAFKHFAPGMLFPVDVFDAASQATSTSAALFITSIVNRMP